MKWFLVIWVAQSSGFVLGDNNFWPPQQPAHTVSAEIAMPSQEVCEAVQVLNPSAECIAKLSKRTSATSGEIGR